MTRRVARRGPNAGNPFWGCSSFPDCRGTRDIGPGDHDVEDSSAAAGTDETGAVGEAESPREAEEAAATQPLPVPVSWQVAAPRNYVAEYAAVSAFPGVLAGGLGLDERLRSAIGQCVVYSRRDRDRGGGPPHARLAGGLLVKLLQRGRLPLPTLEIERAALAVHGLADRADDLSADGVELGWRAPGVLDALDRDSLLRVACRRAPFELAPGVDFDPNAASQGARIGSAVERRFLCDWVPKALGPSAGQWFTPQAPLDQLARSLAGGEQRSEDVAARRVDFLYCHPGGTLGRPAAWALLGLWQDADLGWVADHVLEVGDRFDNAGLREETLAWRLERAVERAATAVDATEQRWAAAPSGRPPPGRPRVVRGQGTTEGSSWT